MSRIDDLLADLCPEGVAWMPVGEVANVGTGRSDRKDSCEGGSYPFYVRSKEILRIDSFEFDEEAIVIPGEGGIGEIFHFVSGKYALHQRAYRISFNSPVIDTKFAYYYFSTHFKRFILQRAVNATVSSIRKPMIMEFPIPVPPLEVQREIVRILDQFTQLEAEVKAELEARRIQYQYFRDNLLTYGDEVPRVPLGTLCYIKTGAAVSKVAIDKNPGSYPVINSGREPLGYIGSFNTENDPIGITSRGAGVGSVTWCDGKYFRGNLNYSVTIIRHQEVDVRFLYHSLLFLQPQIQRLATYQGIPALNKVNLEKLLVPLPSMDIQLSVAEVLDKINSLANDPRIGLPAELAARRKQYEYYRDRLLTFNEAAV